MRNEQSNCDVEKKAERKTLILTTLVCLIPVIAGILLYPKLPAEIATHWDLAGNVNGVRPKFVGAIVYPSVLVIINLILPFLMKTDPKYKNLGSKLKLLVQWIIPCVSMFASGSTLAYGMGIDVPIEIICPMFIGMLFVLIGNYLPKTRQSYTLGIKLPWTLYSEENWDHTHRMAGYLWIIGGFVMIIGSLFKCRVWLFSVCIIAMVAIPTIYSYLYYRKENS